MRLSREKILHECRLLRERLQECSAKFLAEEQDNFTIDPSSLPDALDLLATSDNRIRLLVAEVNFKMLWLTNVIYYLLCLVNSSLYY